MRLKFIGKFTDLKKMGYKFHKLYAMNYKVYIKDDILIWVGGRDIEFRNMYHSAKIAEMILDDTYPVYREDVSYGDKDGPGLCISFKKGEPLGCVINNETGEVTTHTEFVKKHGYRYDRDVYQELYVSLKLIEAIKELKDMFKIEDD
jgi:hypothetical protein